MTHIKVQVRIGMDSGIPNDASVNTWHINEITPTTGTADFIGDLEDFYGAIDGLYSTAVDGTAFTWKAYDMTDPEPRAPVSEGTFATMTTNSTAWPPECAMCLSFQAARVSGSSQARRRGRVYIGPLANLQVSSSNPQLDNIHVQTLATAANALLTASTASTSYHWCVYSQADNATLLVDNGWVDNAVDIQRRRGLAATVRNTWG